LPKFKLDSISEVFCSTVDEVVSEHYDAKTQEHQLTARIGRRVEDRFKQQSLFGTRVQVITQDIPDKGRGALERPPGLTSIGVSVDGAFNKGLLIQAEWDDNPDPELRWQAQRMHNLCPKGSYVWSYGKDGVRAMRAEVVVRNPMSRPSSWSDNLAVVAKSAVVQTW
jgi:hypothetical protein